MDIGKYIESVRVELAQLTWPSSREAGMYTGLVIGISALIAVFATGVDFGMVEFIGKFVGK